MIVIYSVMLISILQMVLTFTVKNAASFQYHTHIPSPIATYFTKFSSTLPYCKKSAQRFSQFSFCSSMRSHGMNFVETWCMPKCSAEIIKHNTVDIPIFPSFLLQLTSKSERNKHLLSWFFHQLAMLTCSQNCGHFPMNLRHF